MSPTVLRVKGFRLFFFSREESRPHVHVSHQNGEAKFWLEPKLDLARNYGLSDAEINRATRLIQERR